MPNTFSSDGYAIIDEEDRDPNHDKRRHQSSGYQNQSANYSNQGANYQTQSANYSNQSANYQNQGANYPNTPPRNDNGQFTNHPQSSNGNYSHGGDFGHSGAAQNYSQSSNSGQNFHPEQGYNPRERSFNQNTPYGEPAPGPMSHNSGRSGYYPHDHEVYGYSEDPKQGKLRPLMQVLIGHKITDVVVNSQEVCIEFDNGGKHIKFIGNLAVKIHAPAIGYNVTDVKTQMKKAVGNSNQRLLEIFTETGTAISIVGNLKAIKAPN